MATRSFTDTYVIKQEDADRFHNIMNNKDKVKMTKVINHQDVKGKDILNFLGIKVK